MHGPPAGPEHHLSHTQSVMLGLPVDELELSGQAVQSAEPFVDLYVPAGHALHWPFEAPVSGPVYPTLHAHLVVEFSLKGMLFKAQQSCIVVVAESALNPAGHSVHNSAPLALENVSGAQDQHDVLARASWY